jgi:hypothetical protein
MACMEFEINKGVIPKSVHIEQDNKIYDEYNTTALIDTLFDKHNYNPKTCRGYDIIKSYSNAVINNDYDYPIFTICDSFKEYNNEDIVCGEYLVNAFTIEKLGGVYFKKQILGWNIVEYLKQQIHDKEKYYSGEKGKYET